MSPPILPVTILAGALGSGKTTLLNRLLRGHHGLRLGVLVNDFGAINIDARLVDYFERDTISLTNGCICCSRQGDLVAGVRRVLALPRPPEHLVVEASGIADPYSVASAFRGAPLRETTRLDSIVTLVDAANVRDPRLDAQLIAEGIQSADLVVLNKIDLVAGETRTELLSWIRSIVPAARVIEAVDAAVPTALVVGAGGVDDAGANPSVGAGSCRARPAASPDHHTGTRRGEGRPSSNPAFWPGGRGRSRPLRYDSPLRESPGNSDGESDTRQHNHAVEYGSWSYTTTQPLAYRRVRAALESLPTAIFRAKGVLALADAPQMRFVAQVVGPRVTIELAGAWGDRPPVTELVFIGAAGAVAAEEIACSLDACVTDAIPLMPNAGMAAPTR